MLECLERYAIRGVWAGTATLTPMSLRLAELLNPELLVAFEENRLMTYAWEVDGLSPVHVSLVLICRKDRRQMTLGASARLDLDIGLKHALCEAVSVRAALSNGMSRIDQRFTQAIISARHQTAFVSFLEELESNDKPSPSAPINDISTFVAERFGIPPVLVDIPSMGEQTVVKAVIPTEDFLLPRTAGRYILSPGYLE